MKQFNIRVETFPELRGGEVDFHSSDPDSIKHYDINDKADYRRFFDHIRWATRNNCQCVIMSDRVA